MNPDEAETLKIIAKAAAGEFAPFGNIVCKLAGESAEEIGLAFRDSVRVWRWERTLKLAEKTKRVRLEQDVAGSDVSMNSPLRVGIVDASCDLLGYSKHLRSWNAVAILDQIRKSATRKKLQHKE